MNNTRPQVSRSHYFNSDYNHKARWLSFFYQVKLIQNSNVKDVLEIGPGNGWVTRILRDFDINVTTVDIDKKLNPDYVASVSKLPLKNNSYDAVCAFEVLEHLPFDTFIKNLKEMARVSKKYVIISLPDKRRTLIHFLLKIPFINYITVFIKIPSFKKHVFDGQHYWEIGKRGYSVSIIKKHIEETGLHLVSNIVKADVPTKHFFVMEKR